MYQVSPRKITEPFRQIEVKTNDLCEHVLKSGYSEKVIELERISHSKFDTTQ